MTGFGIVENINFTLITSTVTNTKGKGKFSNHKLKREEFERVPIFLFIY